MHEINDLVAQYGLLALFAGVILEGETVAMTGGVLAHRGLLVVWQVWAVIAAAAFCSDLGWFFTGRRFGGHPLVQRMMRREGVSRVMARVHDNPRKLTAVFRFIPGLRILGPLALSQSPLTARVYVGMVAVTDCIWSAIFTAAGLGVGAVLVRLLGGGHRTEHILIGAGVLILAAIAATWWFYVHRWRRG